MATSKARTVVGWVLAGLLTLLMVFSAFGKFTGNVEPLIAMGLGDRLVMLGIGELVTAVLFLIPMTLPVGAFLQSAYWGGAIAAHMVDGTPFSAPAIFLVLVWVVTFIRRPEMFAGLFSPKG
ncbi:MAG: DoxX family protein [Spirochaetales bacterium]|nr:DoxX family protein [Spirochaetales bacterium]